MAMAACADRWGVTTEDWVRFCGDPAPELRKKLLTKYVSLVRHIAICMKAKLPGTTELADLISIGTIGLVGAFGNFDPDRGVKFETYATPRIRGAILDESRTRDWVPRLTRTRAKKVRRAATALSNKLGRQPERLELANHLNYSPGDLDLVLAVTTSSPFLSLDEEVYLEGDTHRTPRVETIIDHTAPSALSVVEKNELQSFVVAAVDDLPERWKFVVGLHYFEGFNFREIGDVMGVTEGRVSQMHTDALRKLRTEWKAGDEHGEMLNG